jgi:hypothetical protein
MGGGKNLIKEVAEQGRTVGLGASSSTTTISLMIVMRRCALKVVASVCPVLTSNKRVVSLL